MRYKERGLKKNLALYNAKGRQIILTAPKKIIRTRFFETADLVGYNVPFSHTPLSRVDSLRSHFRMCHHAAGLRRNTIPTSASLASSTCSLQAAVDSVISSRGSLSNLRVTSYSINEGLGSLQSL